MLFFVFLCFLSVQAGPPVFNDDASNISAKENVILKVRCSATGDPEPTYEWYNEHGKEVGPHLNPRAENDVNSGSVIVFNVTHRGHSGGYTCLAKNSHGLRSKVFEINIIAQEDGANIEVVNVTETSVTFSLVPHGADEVYDLKYREIYENTTYYGRYTDKERTIVVKRLIPSGQYSFNFSRQVRSVDKKEWTFNLTAILLPAKPEVIFQSLHDGLLTFTWNRKFDDFMRKTIDKYHLTYRTVRQIGVKGTWLYDDCYVSIEIPLCATPKYTIAALSKNTYYEISLRGHTSAGYGEPSQNKIFMP